MSKKCCGILYSDDDSVCKICGKPLSDMETDDEPEKSEKIENPEEESSGNDGRGDVKASRGLKLVGILALVIAILGLCVIGLSVYFLVVSPTYVKDGMSKEQLIFPEIATDMDADMYEVREALATGTDATATDATAMDAEAVNE